MRNEGWITMDSTAIAEAFRSGDVVQLINALEITGVEIIPLPGDEQMLLGTVGGTMIVVTSDGAMRLHGHSDAVAAQACQARLSGELWQAVTAHVYQEAGMPLEYAGKHVMPE